MNWYLGVWKKYAVFGGRARRQEFWMFVLLNFVAELIAGAIDGALGTGLVYPVYSLAVLIPGLAVACRRLHDTNRSGWYLLLGLIPLVGWIIVLVLMCLNGQAGDNKYGPDPKAGNIQA